jgi:hypothetical protein
MLLDKKTLDFIYDMIADLQIKNDNQLRENKTDYARGQDDAYKTCMKIISAVLIKTKKKTSSGLNE